MCYMPLKHKYKKENMYLKTFLGWMQIFFVRSIFVIPTYPDKKK